MKSIVIATLALSTLLLGGCATKDLASRKQERLTAYSGLPEETRSLIDQGRIQVGMTEDAVYIAWGQPDEILQRENQNETVTTWLYHGVYLDEHRYWRHQTLKHDGKTSSTPYLAHEYRPHSYVSAKVEFKGGQVADWETLPRPHY